MSTALLIFPHQLFAAHPGLEQAPDRVLLVEHPLFFGDVAHPAHFHKQKLWLHRASMMKYADRLAAEGHTPEWVRYAPDTPVMRHALASLAASGVTRVLTCDPIDLVLNRRLDRQCGQLGLALERLDTPMFLNTAAENSAWRQGRKRWFMAEFYKHQRRRLDLLMDGDEPEGGRWSFDEDNRKKVPRKRIPEVPAFQERVADAVEADARRRVLADFPDHPGRLDRLYWPTDHDEAGRWLDTFVQQRLQDFGPYEDAIVAGKSLLWHSAITPMLNIGLLTPDQVIDVVMEHVAHHDVPLNSTEGFVRQVIGWREFMRATYEDLGVRMRTTNHWNHTRKMPQSFWTGDTGIAPVDDAIRRVLDTGYCHHIERLMVLGGFFFVCEIDPDDIYRWFMEMFVDAYDWVMVPNAYAMSQNADGGLITTKPYFSGSNYIRKMGNHDKGEWCDIWDGLYWRWILKHADALAKNPRWSMMVATGRRMSDDKRKTHLDNANGYLDALFGDRPDASM